MSGVTSENPPWPYVTAYLLCLVALFGMVAILGWQDGWSLVGFIPHAEIFNDARVLQGALLSAEVGLDPTLKNPHHFGEKLMNYPLIWMRIGDWLGIVDETRFLFCVTSYLAIFIIAMSWLIYRFPSVTLVIAAVSGSTVWVFEMGNNDAVFFSILLFAFLVGGRRVQTLLVVASAILKLYPIFGVLALVNWDGREGLIARLRWAVIAAVVFLVYLFWNLASILHAVEITPKGGGYSYGLWTVAFLIDERAPGVPITHSALLIAQLIATLPLILFCRRISTWFGFPNTETDTTNAKLRDLFLTGAAIYVASYVLTGNWDYRMIFVIFTIPFMLRIDSRALRTLFVFSVVTGMNFAYLTEVHAVIGGVLNILGKALLHYILSAALIAYCLPRLLDSMRFDKLSARMA